MKLVIFSPSLSFCLSFSLLACVSGSSSAGPGSPSVPYRTVLYRTVPYCILVFVITFCMSVASVKCMHIVALHYLFYPSLHPSVCLSVCLWGVSVCLPVSICHFTLSVCLSALLSGLRSLSICLPVVAYFLVCLTHSFLSLTPLSLLLALFPSNFFLCASYSRRAE